MLSTITELVPYGVAALQWPAVGRHILASYDAETIIVYQAFNEAIASYAVEHQAFVGCPAYSTTRMTWIKTNFLWMMYRCGWATKDAGQHRVLAIRLSRDGFEEIMRRSVITTHGTHATDEWKRQLESSEVRLQWDPDHFPSGDKCLRRAIQLGIKGRTLHDFHSYIVGIEDITDTVVLPQAKLALEGPIERQQEELVVPLERVYVPSDCELQQHIGIDTA